MPEGRKEVKEAPDMVGGENEEVGRMLTSKRAQEHDRDEQEKGHGADTKSAGPEK